MSMFRSCAAPAFWLAATAVACSTAAPAAVDHSCDGLSADQLASAPRAACSDDLPSESDCGGALPSYQAEIAGVVAERCGACHGPGGLEASLPLATHAQIFAQRRTVLNQIFTCAMPPACAHDLSADERASMLKWMVCGSLDN